MRSAYPVGHLKLIVDSEGADRPSDDSIDVDDAMRDAWIRPEARRPFEKRAAIGLMFRCEGGHSDRLRVRHLLIDRVEIRVLKRPQRDVHLATLSAALPGRSRGRLRQRSGMSPEQSSLTAHGLCCLRPRTDCRTQRVWRTLCRTSW